MIPVCEPKFFGNEKKYVDECLDTNWISSAGKFMQLFEESFADFIGVKHGVSCCNGTVAIHLAMESLGIGKGDEVIIPDLSNIATANGVILTGAKVVLVDIEKDTLCIDPKKIEEKITPRSKAILVVHLYGHPTDMDPILRIAKKYNLYVVEDCAEAHGAEYNGKKVGSLGDMATFSFYANKIVTTGEGGMVVTNDDKFAERARLIRNLAFTEPRFHHSVLGFNYRLTNVQAAIGYAQMEKIKHILKEKLHVMNQYNKLLSGQKGITLPKEASWAKNVYWMYTILIEPEFGLARDEVMRQLGAKGIDTRSIFYPFHLQPLFVNGNDERFPDCSGKYPVSEEVAQKGLYLPSGIGLKGEEIKKVVDTLLSLRRK
jgi:perosamine synthetase